MKRIIAGIIVYGGFCCGLFFALRYLFQEGIRHLFAH
jgi:hypothetical protein